MLSYQKAGMYCAAQNTFHNNLSLGETFSAMSWSCHCQETSAIFSPSCFVEESGGHLVYFISSFITRGIIQGLWGSLYQAQSERKKQYKEYEETESYKRTKLNQ